MLSWKKVIKIALFWMDTERNGENTDRIRYMQVVPHAAVNYDTLVVHMLKIRPPRSSACGLNTFRTIAFVRTVHTHCFMWSSTVG